MNNTDFVRFLYDLVLERSADGEGLAHWTTQLESGLPPMQLYQSLCESQEAKVKRAGDESKVMFPGRAERATPFYFMHIPKTAGMSVYAFLDQVFSAEEVFPGWLTDHLRTSDRDLRTYKLFRGHFLRISAFMVWNAAPNVHGVEKSN